MNNGIVALLVTLTLVAPGCASLRDSGKVENARFRSFEDARDAFLEIVAGQTTAEDLRSLRIDPADAGVRVLAYANAGRFFVLHKRLPLTGQADAVQQCIQVGRRCRIWRVSQGRERRKRLVNIIVDVLRFRRWNHVTGWQFEGAVFLVDDVATYTVWGGIPRISEFKDDVRPLGLLQGGPRLVVERGRSRPRVFVGGEQE
jgi:hypothetical protein